MNWPTAVVLAVLSFAVEGFAASATSQPVVDGYQVKNLASDGSVQRTKRVDVLNGPWGLASTPTGPWWVGNNASGLVSLLGKNGAEASLRVTIPAAIGSAAAGSPVGVAYNGGDNFKIKQAALSAPARFIFTTEDGTISGWNRSVSQSAAVKVVDRSSAQAVYRGVALGNVDESEYLYAANFRAGQVEIFDRKFRNSPIRGAFDDETIPEGFAPFNVANIKGKLYVSFAEQDKDLLNDLPGSGSGFVDVFDTRGNLQRRLVTGGKLNSPWGMALAPRGFGQFSNTLLVGNMGDGRINSYDPNTGRYKGTLADSHGDPIEIDGLRGLAFGNGGAAGSRKSLYFSAGFFDESDGLFGRIDFAAADASAAGALNAINVPEPGGALAAMACAGLIFLRRRVCAKVPATQAQHHRGSVRIST